MKKIWIAALLPLVLLSCNGEQKGRHEFAKGAVEGVVSADSVTGTKISKTSEMRFRVKNVQHSKIQLSTLIRAQGGSLLEASTESRIVDTEKVPYCIDSLLELNSYRTDGLVVAKIPAAKLDDFTAQVVKMAVFVDYQAIKLEDLTANFKTNTRKTELQQKAGAEMDAAGKTAQGIAKQLEIAERKIDQQEANRSINNRVAFSTVTLNFYQDNMVQRVVIGNDQLSAYKPAFFHLVGLNLMEGWNIFKEVILFIVQLWMVILVAILLFMAYRRYKRRGLK